MASKEVEQVQSILDDAFAGFRQENPELAEAIQVLNISYAEYLRLLSGLSFEPETVSGNAQTPTITLTPTWRGLLPALVQVAANAETAEARKMAMDELYRMADAVDAMNLKAQSDKPDEVSKP